MSTVNSSASEAASASSTPAGLAAPAPVEGAPQRSLRDIHFDIEALTCRQKAFFALMGDTLECRLDDAQEVFRMTDHLYALLRACAHEVRELDALNDEIGRAAEVSQ